MMNLLKWNPFWKLEEVFKRFKSYLLAISILRRSRSRNIDYTGLNAALRRYKQGRRSMPDQDRSSQK